MTSERLCHTFNSRQLINKYGAKFTSRPGGDYGLDLVINTENMITLLQKQIMQEYKFWFMTPMMSWQKGLLCL